MENEKRTITGCNEEIVKKSWQETVAYSEGTCKPITWEQGVKLLKTSMILDAELIDEPVPDGLYLILKRPNGDIINFLIEPEGENDDGLPAPILAGVCKLQEGKGCE